MRSVGRRHVGRTWSRRLMLAGGAIGFVLLVALLLLLLQIGADYVRTTVIHPTGSGQGIGLGARPDAALGASSTGLHRA